MALSEKSILDNIKKGNLEGSGYKKPCMSYAQLIAEALSNAPEKTLVLSDIYKTINSKYPYYELETQVWQNSIRQNLTLNKNFIKNVGKHFDQRGWYWKLSENHSIPPLKVLKVSADTKYKICSKCNKGFTSLDELKYHIAKVHSFVQEGKLQIPYKMKKDFYRASLHVGMEDSQSGRTPDQTEIQ